MNRRQYLATASSVLALGLSGCTQSDGGDSDTPTPTSTPTTTPTSTREPTTTRTSTTQPAREPELLQTSLVSRWEDFGDVESNAITAVGQGATALLGARYSVMTHDGTVDITTQTRVFDPGGSRVGLEDFSDEQLSDGDGMQTWENVTPFDTTDWTPGEYTYEVLVRDNVSGDVSETMEGDFDVNDPLGAGAVELADVDAPDTVAVGDPYSFTLTFENVSTRDGSLVSPASTKFQRQSSWSSISDVRFTATMAAGGTNTWRSTEVTFNQTGVVQYRVDAIDAVWSVEVTE